MKTIRLFLLLTALAGLTSLAHAAESVNVRGILVSSSNEPGKSDPRLAAYAANLRRILRAESVRFVGDDSASMPVPGKGAIAPGGQRVQLQAESADGKTVVLHASWGGTSQDYVVQRGGGTTLLVGPPAGNKGEVYAVLIIAR